MHPGRGGTHSPKKGLFRLRTCCLQSPAGRLLTRIGDARIGEPRAGRRRQIPAARPQPGSPVARASVVAARREPRGSLLPSRRPLCGEGGGKAKKKVRKEAPLQGRIRPDRCRFHPAHAQGDNFVVASGEVFQVRPSAFHSLAALDAGEILFIGARASRVIRAVSFHLFFYFFS